MVYVFYDILIEEEWFSNNSTSQTLETWVPFATFNKSLICCTLFNENANQKR